MSAWCLLLNGAYIISKEDQEKIARTLIRVKKASSVVRLNPKGQLKTQNQDYPFILSRETHLGSHSFVLVIVHYKSRLTAVVSAASAIQD